MFVAPVPDPGSTGYQTSTGNALPAIGIDGDERRMSDFETAQFGRRFDLDVRVDVGGLDGIAFDDHRHVDGSHRLRNGGRLVLSRFAATTRHHHHENGCH